jgi:hypothetical protein
MIALAFLQRMFGITERRARAYAERHGGKAQSMADAESCEVIRGMLRDWDAATPAQRAEALRNAAKLAEVAP